MTAETLAAIWEAIITTYDEFAIGFSLEPEKVKDRSVDLELPRAFWAMPRVTVRWVAGTGAYDQTFGVNILFLGQTASDRTADTATGTHSDMAIAAQRCLERFIDLYVNGDTLFMGEVVNIERIGAGTLSPIIDEDTTQLTGVNLRIDVTVRASECAAEYFDGIPSETADCDAATVTNSDDSYMHTVASGATLELPDVTHTDSDGTEVVLPAMTPFEATLCEGGGPCEECPECDPATAVVKNSAGTVLETEEIPSGGSEDIVVADATVNLVNGYVGLIGTQDIASGVTTNVPVPDTTIQLKDTEDQDIGSPFDVPSGQLNEVPVPDANYALKNSSDFTLASQAIHPGDSVDVIAPDADYTLRDSAGAAISNGSIPSGDSDVIIAPDGTVYSTDGSVPVMAVKSNGTANLPQSVIKYKDAADADQVTAASNTEYASGTLRPATQVPRRELTRDGAGTGQYVTLANLIANTVPNVTTTRGITASWAAGNDETIPIILPAEYQGQTFDYVSNTGTNGTITVSVDGGSTFSAPPFTVGSSGVAFRRTTYSGAGSVLYEV